MKNFVLFVLSLSGIMFLFSCGKTYDANTATYANQSANPLNLLDNAGFNSQWTDSTPTISAYINGVFMNIDSSHCAWFRGSISGCDSIIGVNPNGAGIMLNLHFAYAGNILNIRDTTSRNFAQYFTSTPFKVYNTTNLGNVGQVQMLRNDNLRMIGRFYYQCLDSVSGNVVNVSNGYFNIHKY